MNDTNMTPTTTPEEEQREFAEILQANPEVEAIALAYVAGKMSATRNQTNEK